MAGKGVHPAVPIVAGVGLVLVGGGLYLSRKNASRVPDPVVASYLARISAAMTLLDLEVVRFFFEADYLAGRMTQANYLILYNAYLIRYNQLAAAPARQSVRRVTVPAGRF